MVGVVAFLILLDKTIVDAFLFLLLNPNYLLLGAQERGDVSPAHPRT